METIACANALVQLSARFACASSCRMTASNSDSDNFAESPRGIVTTGLQNPFSAGSSSECANRKFTSRRSTSFPHCKSKNTHEKCEGRGFQEVAAQSECHDFLSLLDRSLSIARMSASVSLPVSTKCDITDVGEPPNISNKSVIRRL